MLSEPSNVAAASQLSGATGGGGAMPEPVGRRATARHHLPSIIRRSRTPKTGATAVAKNDASRAGASPVAKTGESPAPFVGIGSTSVGKTGSASVDKTGSSSSSVETGESPLPKAAGSPAPVVGTGSTSVDKTGSSSSSVETGESRPPKTGVPFSPKTGVTSSVTPITKTGSSFFSKTSKSAVPNTGASTIAKSSVPAVQSATSAPQHIIVKKRLRTVNKIIHLNGAPEAEETETSAPGRVAVEKRPRTAIKGIALNGAPEAGETETVHVPRVVHVEPSTADERAVDIEGALFIDETAYETVSTTKIVGSSCDFDTAASLLNACYEQLVADAKASDPEATNVKVVLNINKVKASDAKAVLNINKVKASDAEASGGEAVSKIDKVKASDAKAVSRVDKVEASDAKAIFKINTVEASDADASDGRAFDAEAVLKVNNVKASDPKASKAKVFNAKASDIKSTDAKTSDVEAVSVVSDLEAGMAGKRLKAILRERTERTVRVVDVPARTVILRDTSSQTRLFSFVDNASIVSVEENYKKYKTIIPTKYKSTSATAPPAKAPIPPPPTPSPPPPDPLPLLGMTRLIVGDTALPLFARAGRVMVEIPGQMLADRGFFDDSTRTDGRRPSLTLGDDTLAMEKVDGKYVVEVPKRLLESLAETRMAEGAAPDPEVPPTEVATAAAAVTPKTGRLSGARLKSAKLKDNARSQAGTPKSRLATGSAVAVPVAPLEPLTVVVNGSDANGFAKTPVGSNDGFLRQALQKKSSEGMPNKKKRTLAAQSDTPGAHTPEAIETPVAQSNSRVADSREAIKTPEAQVGVLVEHLHYLTVGVGGHRLKRENRLNREREYKSSKRRKVEKFFRELAQTEVAQPKVAVAATTRRSSRIMKVAEGNPEESERNSGQSETSSDVEEEPEMPEAPPGGSKTQLGLLAPSEVSIQTAVNLEVSKMLGEGSSQEEPVQSLGAAPDSDLGMSLPEITPQSVRLTPNGEQAKGIKRRKLSGPVPKPSPPTVSKPTPPPAAKPTLPPAAKPPLPPVAKPTPPPGAKPTPPPAAKPPPPPAAKPTQPPVPKLKLLVPKSILSVSYTSLPVPKSALPVPKLKWLIPKPPASKLTPPPVKKATPPVAKMLRSTRRGAKTAKVAKVDAAPPPLPVVDAAPTPDAATAGPSSGGAPAAAPDGGVGIRQVNDRLLREAFEDWTDCVKRDETTGNVPLHEAVLDGDMAAVRKQCALLLARKTSVDVLNNDRETPLHLALKLRLGDAVRELRRRGARLATTDDAGNTALHLAVMHGLPDGVATLLEGEGRPGERPPLEVLNDEGYAPLHLAALHNSEPDTKTLLKHKADVDQKDAKSGRTPLFIAVENNLRDVVRLLLQAGASIAEQNYSGQTPMSAANELDGTLLLS